jgi:hypothetical protein
MATKHSDNCGRTTDRLRTRRFENVRNESDSYVIIWLDKNVNATEKNFQTQRKLREIVSQLVTFEDIRVWINRSIDLTKRKVILLLSESYGHQFLPLIHYFSQVKLIYVYSSVEKSDPWNRKYKKVSSVLELSK